MHSERLECRTEEKERKRENRKTIEEKKEKKKEVVRYSDGRGRKTRKWVDKKRMNTKIGQEGRNTQECKGRRGGGDNEYVKKGGKEDSYKALMRRMNRDTQQPEKKKKKENRYCKTMQSEMRKKGEKSGREGKDKKK